MRLIHFLLVTAGAKALEQALCEGDEIEERLSHGVQDGTYGHQPGKQCTQ